MKRPKIGPKGCRIGFAILIIFLSITAFTFWNLQSVGCLSKSWIYKSMNPDGGFENMPLTSQDSSVRATIFALTALNKIGCSVKALNKSIHYLQSHYFEVNFSQDPLEFYYYVLTLNQLGGINSSIRQTIKDIILNYFQNSSILANSFTFPLCLLLIIHSELGMNLLESDVNIYQDWLIYRLQDDGYFTQLNNKSNFDQELLLTTWGAIKALNTINYSFNQYQTELVSQWINSIQTSEGGFRRENKEFYNASLDATYFAVGVLTALNISNENKKIVEFLLASQSSEGYFKGQFNIIKRTSTMVKTSIALQTIKEIESRALTQIANLSYILHLDMELLWALSLLSFYFFFLEFAIKKSFESA